MSARRSPSPRRTGKHPFPSMRPPRKNTPNDSIFAMNLMQIPNESSMTGGSFQSVWLATMM